MDLVTRLGDPTTMLLGHRIIGISLHYIGDQPSARIHLNQIHEQYSRAVHRLQTIGSRLDHGTAARATLARVLWLQGEPDEALRLSNVAKADAFADDHLLSLLYVLVESVIPLSLVLGDYEETGRSLEILMERATRGGFRIWQIYGRCFREVLRIRQGDGAPGGIQRFIEAIRDLRNSGFCAHLPMFLCLLATDLADAGRETEALSTIDEAIDWSESRGARWYGPELLRSKADIILRTSSPAAAIEAEARLRQALAQARQQGALAWELRAATSLARLLRQQGHAEAACDILSPIYARFSEGFDTPDLISARDLLN